MGGGKYKHFNKQEKRKKAFSLDRVGKLENFGLLKFLRFSRQLLSLSCFVEYYYYYLYLQWKKVGLL